MFAGSPFLTDCLLAEPGVLRLLLEQGAEPAYAVLMGELADVPVGERTRLMAGTAPRPAPARAADRAHAT